MLAWMIKNCEDSRSVEVALQAIGDARYGLPPKPLIKCKALELVSARLNNYANPDMSFKPKDQNMDLSVHGYYRAYVILQFGGTALFLNNARALRKLLSSQVDDHLDNIKKLYNELSHFWNGRQLEFDNQIRVLLLLQQWEPGSQQWTVEDDATVSNFSMPQGSDITGVALEANPIGCMRSSENNTSGDARSSASRLFVLSRLSAQYLVVCWANDEPQNQKQCPLPAMLVCIFFKIRASEPIISNTL
ncbi:hypothetical protein RhiLY_07572 [Ceratobasidium sp. AG-Ba]|nr:hypothetical protein RhiLY_07572 [Ceratobasidium sp. AG-Ba]